MTPPPAPGRPHVFYLHGFASSEKSTKAGFFAERLRAHGIALRCPDFNQPDFASLTMTRMLDQLAAEVSALAAGPIVLLGSGLGGTLAILAADRLGARIDRVVLFAPPRHPRCCAGIHEMGSRASEDQARKGKDRTTAGGRRAPPPLPSCAGDQTPPPWRSTMRRAIGSARPRPPRCSSKAAAGA